MKIGFYFTCAILDIFFVFFYFSDNYIVNLFFFAALISMLYSVQLNDGCVTMTGEICSQLIREIPTLGYILFGHPDMQSISLCPSDAVEIVYLSNDFNISKDVFGDIVALAIGVKTHMSSSESTINAVQAVGGFDLLKRIQDQENKTKHMNLHLSKFRTLDTFNKGFSKAIGCIQDEGYSFLYHHGRFVTFYRAFVTGSCAPTAKTTP